MIGCRLPAFAVLLIVAASVHGAAAQQLLTGAQPPTARGAPPLATPQPRPGPTPFSPQTPAPAQTAVPAQTSPPAQTATLAPSSTGFGLCQCIGDANKLNFSCPGSVAACQSACGAQYSFKPDALCRAPGADQ
jgi:hypothetical protein